MSQHDTCTCKAIWLTCGVRWVSLFLSLSCGQLGGGGVGGGRGGGGVAKQLPMISFQHDACDIK